MGQRINTCKTQNHFLKFLSELLSTKSKILKQENAPTHTTLLPLEPMTESFEASAMSPQLKDRTKKFSFLFSGGNVKDETTDQVEIFEEKLEKRKLQSQKMCQDKTLNSHGDINGYKYLQESDYHQKMKTEVRNMFLNTPNALAQMRGHNALRRDSLFDSCPLSERRPVITSDDLTEEEMAALWVDIFKPLDVMGMILSHKSKTLSRQGQWLSFRLMAQKHFTIKTWLIFKSTRFVKLLLSCNCLLCSWSVM